MSHKFIFNSSFHSLLIKIDEEFANEAYQAGCVYCGNRLHQSNYPRSPMGLPLLLRPHYEERLSFCCATCRKRITPKSVRFFGRRWFPAHIFLLICLLDVGINERRLWQVKRHCGIVVSESTWKRWRRWWRESFGSTLFWQQQRGFVVTSLGDHPLCLRHVFGLFKGHLTAKMILLLRWLSPLTGGVLRAV